MKIKIILTLLLTANIAHANPLTNYACSDLKREIVQYKQEVNDLNQEHKDSVFKLLKGRNDIELSVKYSYRDGYLVCADFIRDYESVYLSCDYELYSNPDEIIANFRLSQIKKELNYGGGK